MALYEGRLFRPVLWLALLTSVMLSSGCQTANKSLFTATGPGWHVQEGQALWRPGREYPELGGDLVLASNEDGCCLIQFAKTPMTLVSAQTTRTNWLLQFPPQRMEFSGRGPGPTALPGFICTRPWPENRSRNHFVLSANRTAAGGWKTPIRAKPWKASSRREFIPETLVVGLAHGGGRPRIVPAAV